MGTHLRVLSESFPMNTKMTWFKCFSKNLKFLVLWTIVASAWEGFTRTILQYFKVYLATKNNLSLRFFHWSESNYSFPISLFLSPNYDFINTVHLLKTIPAYSRFQKIIFNEMITFYSGLTLMLLVANLINTK